MARLVLALWIVAGCLHAVLCPCCWSDLFFRSTSSLTHAICPHGPAGRSGPFTPHSVGHTYTETIYLLGNPLVIWMVLGGLVGVVALLLLYARYRTDRLMALPARTTRFVTAAIFCFLAYWLNLLPYLMVRRSSFIYHYSEWTMNTDGSRPPHRQVRSPSLVTGLTAFIGRHLPFCLFACLPAPASTSPPRHCSARPGVRRDDAGPSRRAAGRQAVDALRDLDRCGRRCNGLPDLRALDLRLPADQRGARAAAVAVPLGLSDG